MTAKDLLAKYVHIACVVSLYWIVSIITVFINKTVLSYELNAPFFVLFYQCFISVLIYTIPKYFAKCFPSQHAYYIDDESPFNYSVIRKVLPLSFVFACMVCFNALCLKFVGVSFYYIGRSLTTVFNVVLTYLLLKTTTSLECIGYCAIIVGGFWLGVTQENNIGSFSLLGTFFGIMGSFALALYSIKNKTVLSAVNNQIWLLSYYNNVYACILFIPMIIINGDLTKLLTNSEALTLHFWGIMTLGGVCGFAIGYVTSLQIKVTSPLTHNISGTAKACAQTVIATYWYEESNPWMWWISNWIILAGSAGYTSAKQKEMHDKYLKNLANKPSVSI